MEPDGEVQAAQTLVSTFSRILGVNLRLENGSKSGTKGQVLRVPFASPHLYTLVERQLAHLLFKSDSKARDLFAKQFSGTTQRAAAKYGSSSGNITEGALERVIDILESRRVTSLWGLLYPGSFSNMKKHLEEATKELDTTAHDNFVHMLAYLDADREPSPGAMDRFIPILRQALGMVERRSFTATLVVARWLISRLTIEMAQAMRPSGGDDGGEKSADFSASSGSLQKEKLRWLNETMRALGGLPENLEHYYSDYSSSAGESSVQAAAGAAMHVDIRKEDALTALLEESSSKVEKEVESIQDQLLATVHSKSSLSEDSRFKVTYLDIPPGQHRPIYASEIHKLKTEFQKVLGRKRVTLEESGTEIDIAAYLEGKLSGRPVPCFCAIAPSKGFNLRLLIDRSGSMAIDQRTLQADLATRTIIAALDFPFVNLSTWGFQGPDDGDVHITKFQGRTPDLLTALKPVEGDTPMHVAVQVAYKDMLQVGNGEKHLVLITDGAPMCAPRGQKLIAKAHLRKLVGQEVAKARRAGVNVSALMVGSKMGAGHTVFEVSPSEMSEMFGSDRFWQRVDEQHLVASLVQLVSVVFSNFLHRR